MSMKRKGIFLALYIGLLFFVFKFSLYAAEVDDSTVNDYVAETDEELLEGIVGKREVSLELKDLWTSTSKKIRVAWYERNGFFEKKP